MAKAVAPTCLDLAALGVPAVHRANGRRYRYLVQPERAEEARTVFGQLKPGLELFAMSKGAFSLVDALRAILEQTGPADVVVSTWTAAGADIQHAQAWLHSQALRSIRFLVDLSFQSRQPGFCATLRDAFGDQAIRVSKVHAKFATIRAGDWRLVLRTSANLTHNPRLETFELSDDPDLFAYFDRIVNAVWNAQPAGLGFEQTPADNERDFEGLFRPALAASADLADLAQITERSRAKR